MSLGIIESSFPFLDMLFCQDIFPGAIHAYMIGSRALASVRLAAMVTNV